jgi:hypothetical protein
MGHGECALPANELRLLYYAETLMKTITAIDKPHLPFPSEVRVPVDSQEIDKSTDEEMIDYLSKYFLSTFTEYKNLVDFNFPELKDSLAVYHFLPIMVVGEIEKQGEHFLGFRYCFLHNDKNCVEITIKKSESIFDYKNRLVMTSAGNVRYDGGGNSTIWQFFKSDQHRRLNTIQKAVYDLLYDDLSRIMNWNVF